MRTDQRRLSVTILSHPSKSAVSSVPMNSLLDLVEVVFQLFGEIELAFGVFGPGCLLVDLTEQVMGRFVVGVELKRAL